MKLEFHLDKSKIYPCVYTSTTFGKGVLHLDNGNGKPCCGHRKYTVKKWYKQNSFPECIRCALKQPDLELRKEILDIQCNKTVI